MLREGLFDLQKAAPDFIKTKSEEFLSQPHDGGQMINVVQEIVDKLRSVYPSAQYDIYTERIEQGFSAPCFSIRQLRADVTPYPSGVAGDRAALRTRGSSRPDEPSAAGSAARPR